MVADRAHGGDDASGDELSYRLCGGQDAHQRLSDHQMVAADCGHELTGREGEAINNHGDEQHTEQLTVAESSTDHIAQTVPDGFDAPLAFHFGNAHPEGEQHGGQVHGSDAQEGPGVAGVIRPEVADVLNQQTADGLTGHPADGHADRIDGQGVDDAALADDVEHCGAAGGVFQGATHSLQEHSGENVPSGNLTGDQQQEQSDGGGELDGQGNDPDLFAIEPVGDDAGERGQEGTWKVFKAKHQTQHEGGVGQGVDEHARNEELHPAGQLGDVDHIPNRPKTRVAKNLKHRGCGTDAKACHAKHSEPAEWKPRARGDFTRQPPR